MKDRIVIMLLGVLLVGCSEHEETLTEPEVPADAVFTVSAADTLLSRFASFENITVKVAHSEKDEGAITVNANADWLTLKTDTLPKDGRRQPTIKARHAARPCSPSLLRQGPRPHSDCISVA